MNIQVEQRSVYGCIKYYPLCEQGKQLAAFIRQKTFDARNLSDIRKMGINVGVTVLLVTGLE
jgi:hypothetical protein